MNNPTLNDFIHAATMTIVEGEPGRDYSRTEATVRECVHSMLTNGYDFIRLPENWKIVRSDHGKHSGVIWKLDRQVVTYRDYDNDRPNELH